MCELDEKCESLFDVQCKSCVIRAKMTHPTISMARLVMWCSSGDDLSVDGTLGWEC